MEADSDDPSPSGLAPPTQVAAVERERINSAATLGVAALIIGTGSILFNVMPLLLSSLAKARSLSESEVGFFASSAMAGALLATLASVLWIRRLPWTWTTGLAALVATTASLGLMEFENYSAILMLGFVLGYGQATLIASPVAMISDTDAPSRNFALIVAVQVVMASVLAAAMPGIDRAGSFSAVMAVMGLITLVCAALAFRLPVRGLRGRTDLPAASPDAAAPNTPVFLGLGGLLIFYIGLTMVWGFAGILGEAWALTPGEVASAVSVSLGAGLVGSLFAGMLGDRIRAQRAIGLGLVGVGITFGLFALEGGYWLFLSTLLAMNGFWNFSLAYQLGMISSFDISGRFAVLMTASQTAGALLGPGMMGVILGATGGFGAGLAFAGFWLVAAYGLFWQAMRSSALRTR